MNIVGYTLIAATSLAMFFATMTPVLEKYQEILAKLATIFG